MLICNSFHFISQLLGQEGLSFSLDHWIGGCSLLHNLLSYAHALWRSDAWDAARYESWVVVLYDLFWTARLRNITRRRLGGYTICLLAVYQVDMAGGGNPLSGVSGGATRVVISSGYLRGLAAWVFSAKVGVRLDHSIIDQVDFGEGLALRDLLIPLKYGVLLRCIRAIVDSSSIICGLWFLLHLEVVLGVVHPDHYETTDERIVREPVFINVLTLFFHIVDQIRSMDRIRTL